MIFMINLHIPIFIDWIELYLDEIMYAVWKFELRLVSVDWHWNDANYDRNYLLFQLMLLFWMDQRPFVFSDRT